MRLLKLLAYGLFGYALYEFIRGMAQEGRDSLSSPGGTRELRDALNNAPGRTNLSGPARGERVATLDADGGSTTRVVGRGVVSS